MTIRFHIHHIVPKHSGGTDSSENLIQLTVEEHAFAHKKLWEETGNEFDRIAWFALSGQITASEASKLAQINGLKNATLRLIELNKENNICKRGGESCRNLMRGIHDPNKKYLKKLGGTVAIKKTHERMKRENFIWIKKDNTTTRIPKIKLKEYEQNGWSIGRCAIHKLVVCEICNKTIPSNIYTRFHGKRCKFNNQIKSQLPDEHANS